MLSGDFCPPVFVSVFADNRGQIVLTASEDLMPDTVTPGAFRIISAGADNIFGTADDANLPITLQFDPDVDARRIIFQASGLEANQRYQVRVDGSQIRGVSGEMIDAEFNGPDMPTGDGTPGGEMMFFARPSSAPIAQFVTSLGTINVRLFQGQTPLSVANFQNYADTGRYDNTFVHRSVENFVIQGGGFIASPPFSQQPPRDPPVLNEPGISNLRGTLAFAKLGNDPNSATNQWFFNLGDNSANLDFQNGGFTVFGEIIDDAGLEIMDAIAALMTINASQVAGAFTDLPVLNEGVTPGSLTADDLMLIERISIGMTTSAEPPDELDADSVSVFGPGSARVTVYDISGLGLGPVSDMIDVRFNGESISSIRLLPGMPAQGAGIALTSSGSVGSVRDARGADAGDLSFLISNAPVNLIQLRGGITGFNLNGQLVAGIQFDEDIDGDGDFFDLTSIFVPSGRINSIHIGGDLGGDVVLNDGAFRIRVDGMTSNVDFVLGMQGIDTRPMNMQLGRVTDSSIISDVRIANLTAVEWVNLDGTRDIIETPGVNRLTITGDRRAGIDGNFNADMILSNQDGLSPAAISRMIVRGVMSNSELLLGGNIGTLIADGGLNNVRINSDQGIGALRAGPVSNTIFVFNGDIGNVRVAEWFGGAILADTLRTIRTTGDRSQGLEGDLAVDMRLAGNPSIPVSIRSAIVSGDLHIGFWEIEGSVGRIVVRGDTRDMDIDLNGSINLFRSNHVERTDIIAMEIRQIRATQWEGGLIQTNVLQRLNITGDNRAGLAGDFRGDINTLRTVRVDIRNDLRDSTITVNEFTFGERSSLVALNVTGVIINSTIRATDTIGSIITNGMVNTRVFANVNQNLTGFPTSTAQVGDFGAIQRILIRGPRGVATPAFESSIIVSNTLGRFELSRVGIDNTGAPFGLAARNINQLSYLAGGESYSFRLLTPSSPAPPPTVQDFQVRLGLLAPPA